MFRKLVQWFAKRKYIARLEFEAATNEINADLSARLARERRVNAEKLNLQATAIEESVKQVDAEEEARKETDEYKNLSEKEKYEDGRAGHKVRQDAVNMMHDNRRTAEAEIEKAKEGEATVKHFRDMAVNGRMVADKIRNL